MSSHTIDRHSWRSSVTVVLLAAFLCSMAGGLNAQTTDKAVDDLVLQAHKALTSGKPDQAVSILRKAIDQAPARADLYLMRSRAFDSAGKFNAAVDDASKYIELEPNDPFGYLNRARVYMSVEKNQLALADADKAIALAPNEPDGYYRRADIYLDMGKDDLAKADETKAEELDRKGRE